MHAKKVKNINARSLPKSVILIQKHRWIVKKYQNYHVSEEVQICKNRKCIIKKTENVTTSYKTYTHTVIIPIITK